MRVLYGVVLVVKIIIIEGGNVFWIRMEEKMVRNVYVVKNKINKVLKIWVMFLFVLI